MALLPCCGLGVAGSGGGRLLIPLLVDKSKIVNVNTHEYSIMKRHSK